MAVAPSVALEERSAQARMASPSRFGDKAFELLTLTMALAVVVLIILIGWQLSNGSSLAIKKFGFRFLITSVSREILRSVPNLQREAAYALGATRWEATRIAVLSYAKKGLFGAVILGLGRALGETMAVTMVIGNTPQIAASLFQPGYTLASVLANEFTEATTDLYLQALFEIGLVLFAITILANLFAQLLLKTMGTKMTTRAVQ